MLKFSIREWLLMVTIVGTAFGWGLREWQLRAEVDGAMAWRGRTGALESALKDVGRRVKYEKSMVFIYSNSEDSWDWSGIGIPTEFAQPSADPEARGP